MTTSLAKVLDKYFYLLMSLLIPVVVIYGFSHTIDKNLIHPNPPRPWLLYLHGAVFSGWLLFFILQSVLVRTRNVRLHRFIGWFGVGLGATMPVLGVAIAIVMARFNTAYLHVTNAASDLIVPLFDMVSFVATFGLAVYWRGKPETHRRLMLIATCVLTAAAFGRFPASILPPYLFYAGVDLLILLGVVRDWIVNRRVHQVYKYALPTLAVCQTVVTYADWYDSPFWLKIAHAILD